MRLAFTAAYNTWYANSGREKLARVDAKGQGHRHDQGRRCVSTPPLLLEHRSSSGNIVMVAASAAAAMAAAPAVLQQ